MSYLSTILIHFDGCRRIFRSFAPIFRRLALYLCCLRFNRWNRICRRLAWLPSTVCAVSFDHCLIFDGWRRIVRPLAPYFSTVDAISFDDVRPVFRLLPLLSTTVVSYLSSSVISSDCCRVFRLLSYVSTIVESYRFFCSVAAVSFDRLRLIFRRLALYLSIIDVVPYGGRKRICRRVASVPSTVLRRILYLSTIPVYFDGWRRIFRRLPPYLSHVGALSVHSVRPLYFRRIIRQCCTFFS